jgi:hypothetical protein
MAIIPKDFSGNWIATVDKGVSVTLSIGSTVFKVCRRDESTGQESFRIVPCSQLFVRPDGIDISWRFDQARLSLSSYKNRLTFAKMLQSNKSDIDAILFGRDISSIFRENVEFRRIPIQFNK